MYGASFPQPNMHYRQPRVNRFRHNDQWNSNAWVSFDHQPLRGLSCMSSKLKHLLCLMVETLHEMTSGSFCFTPSQALKRTQKRKQRLNDARHKAAMFEKQLYKFVNPNLVTTLNRRTAKALYDAERIIKLITKLRKQEKKAACYPEKQINCCELVVKLKTMLIRQKCEWQCVGRLKETMTIAREMKTILKFISQLARLLNNTANTGFQRHAPERPPSYEITCGLTDDSISNFHSQRMGDNTFDMSGLLNDNMDLISSISPCLMNTSTRHSQSEITISLALDLDEDDDTDDDDDNRHNNRHSRCRKACTKSCMRRPSSARTESLDRSFSERSRDCVRKSGNKIIKRRRPVSQGPSPTINVNLSADQAHKPPRRLSSLCKKQRHSHSCSSTPKKSVKKCGHQSQSEPRSTRKKKKYTTSPKRKITISAQCDDEGPIMDESKEYQSKDDEEDLESHNSSSDHFSDENEPQEREKQKTCHAASPPKTKPRKGCKCMSPKKIRYPCERQSSISPKSQPEPRCTRKKKKYTTSPKRKITISAQCDAEGPIMDESKEYQSKDDEEDLESHNLSSDHFSDENEQTCRAASPPKAKPRKGCKCRSPKKIRYPCKRQSSISPKVSHRGSKQKSKSVSPKLSSKFKNRKCCKQQSLSDIEESGHQSKELGVEIDKMQNCKEHKDKADVCGDSCSEMSSEGDSSSSSANDSENLKRDWSNTFVIKTMHQVHPKKTKRKDDKDQDSCSGKKKNFGQSPTSITSGESREPLIISSREMKINIDEIDCGDMKLCDCKTLHGPGCKCQICQRGKNNNLQYSPHGTAVSFESSNRRMMMTICLEEELNGAEFLLHPCLSSTESTQSLESDKEECPKECLAVKEGNECCTQVTQTDQVKEEELDPDETCRKSSVHSRGTCTVKEELQPDEEPRRSQTHSRSSLVKEEVLVPRETNKESTATEWDDLWSGSRKSSKGVSWITTDFDDNSEDGNSSGTLLKLKPSKEVTSLLIMLPTDDDSDNDDRRIGEDRQSFLSLPRSSVAEDEDRESNLSLSRQQSEVEAEDRQSNLSLSRQREVEEDTGMWYETAKGQREFLEKWWKFLLLLFINLYILYILWCVITSPECLTCNSIVPNIFLQFITSAKRSVRLIHYSPAPV